MYDGLGRTTQDRVTTVCSGVDGAVRRIGRTYEVRGMVEQITSYDDPDVGEGTVLNDIVREYDTIGRLTKEYQEHEGAKDGNTLYVEYGYAALATALRPTSIRYPNGRHVYFDYSGTHDGNLNRLTAILDNDGSTVLSQYTWLGLGTMVVEDFAQPDVKLDYFGGASGTYAGFDNFGRVVDQKWYDYGASAVRDQYTYGYDRAGNRLYRENTGPSGKDEYYTYDGIYRLVNFDRGDLNANKDAITGTPAREEDFTLDPTGNWTAYVQKTSGSTDLNQSRDHDEVNEITDVTETQGTAWITPVHDKAGNMITVPKPSSLANGLTCTYDAWNRLVEVEDATAEVVVARYEYDGTRRRIKKHLDSQSPADPDGIDTYEHYFHSGAQVIETRDTDTENAEPESLQPVCQYVWSIRYVDSPVLRDENTDQDSLCDDARIYYLTDANFNVTALIDTAGDAIERYAYDPYGHVTIYDATWTNTRSSSFYTNPTLYTGQQLDRETNLYYYRARYYNPALGRFTGRDPVGFRGGDANLYRYVRGNPLLLVDPRGLDPLYDVPGASVDISATLDERTQQPTSRVVDTSLLDLIPLRELTPLFTDFPPFSDEAIDDIVRASSLASTERGRVQLDLETLCQCKCLSCKKWECRDEARQIADAYVQMFHEKKTWRSNNLFVSLYGKSNDYRFGWMCYQWQTHTFNALESIVRKGRCFDIRRVGRVKEHTEPPHTDTIAYPPIPALTRHFPATSWLTLEHNWVAISAVRTGGVYDMPPEGQCTVYLDPWIGQGPVVYRYVGGAYQDRHPTPNFLGDTVLGDRARPEGISGAYMPPGRPAVLRDFLGWK